MIEPGLFVAFFLGLGPALSLQGVKEGWAPLGTK
jgi:hypothetical protein